MNVNFVGREAKERVRTRACCSPSINLTAKSVQIAVDWRAQIEAARPIDLRKLTAKAVPSDRRCRRLVATAALTRVGPAIHRHFTDDARISRTNAKHGCVDYRSNYSADWGASSNFSHTPPGHLIFGLRSSCERAELMLDLVTRVTPVSTLADTFSPFEAASAVLTPS